MANFADQDSIEDFIDDNAIDLFVDENGIFLGLGGGGSIDTETSVLSSLNPSTFGAFVTFTASVIPVSGVIVPTGTVTFKDSASTIGTDALDGAGFATLGTSGLSVGSHSITAVYGGDVDFNSSTSSILTQVVNSAPPPPSSNLGYVAFNA